MNPRQRLLARSRRYLFGAVGTAVVATGAFVAAAHASVPDSGGTSDDTTVQQNQGEQQYDGLDPSQPGTSTDEGNSPDQGDSGSLSGGVSGGQAGSADGSSHAS